MDAIASVQVIAWTIGPVRFIPHTSTGRVLGQHRDKRRTLDGIALSALLILYNSPGVWMTAKKILGRLGVNGQLGTGDVHQAIARAQSLLHYLGGPEISGCLRQGGWGKYMWQPKSSFSCGHQQTLPPLSRPAPEREGSNDEEETVAHGDTVSQFRLRDLVETVAVIPYFGDRDAKCGRARLLPQGLPGVVIRSMHVHERLWGASHSEIVTVEWVRVGIPRHGIFWCTAAALRKRNPS